MMGGLETNKDSAAGAQKEESKVAAGGEAGKNAAKNAAKKAKAKAKKEAEAKAAAGKKEESKAPAVELTAE